MALAEEVIFKATLDANNFDRAAANMRRSAESAGAAATTAGQRFSAASGQTQSMSKSTLTLSQRFKNFEPVLGRTATGISGVAGALQNTVGQTNAVSGAIAGMSSALVGGGALALGIGGITLLVGYLAEAWMRAGEEAEEAARKQKAATQSLAEQIQSKVESQQEELAKMLYGTEGFELKMARIVEQIKHTKAEIEDLQTVTREDIRLFGGLRAAQAAIAAERAAAQERLFSLQATLANAQDSYEDYLELKKQITAAEKKSNKEKEAEIRLTKGSTKATKEHTKALKELDDVIGMTDGDGWLGQRQQFRALHGKADKDFKKREADRIAREKALQDRWDDDADAARDKRDEKAMARAEKLRQEEIEAEKKKNAELLAAQEKANQEKLAVLRVYSGEATGIINGAFATSLDALERVVAGEKVALHEMLILWATSTMKQAGIRIFGSGLATFIDGALMNSVVPGSGVAAMKEGAVAMGIGAGLGAGGAVGGGVASRMGIGGAGGTGAAGQTPGVNSGSLGGAGSRGEAGGGETRNTYVFNAPVYGSETESAQEQSRLQKIARDDLLERA